eukprot:CAMPEP_0119107928 /NCGR_PEP_ID=MMETSP1180-20130426/12454_1 /TAXON_ID=3052 ORGANISM="Chlamydomonas cf sp, Strain CCMP681" /NCGR_SAMPLE_ID=MMETSP1180 /ASSEMBLY_ACC=CAM_ASM_000741 /LENGTH=140 /DNA_ID=CAMNT_0007093479 /DNA_START=75 /DNA_END=497 /DNA_ORIENTATION=+
MDQPASVERVQKAVESMVEGIQRSHLVPAQKEAFLCCARCCDANGSTKQMQSCVEQCSMPPLAQQQQITRVMQDFQERFQRAAMRCNDRAQETSGFDPTLADEAKAKKVFLSCMAETGTEFEAKVPKLKQDIISSLNRRS